MSFHATSKRIARGSACPGGQDSCASPRIAVSLPEDDMRRLAWWAAKKGVPVAAVIRDAVWAYLLPIAADADAANKVDAA